MSTKNQNNLTKTLATTPFLNLYQTTFKKRSGIEGKWTWAGRPNETAAVFIAAIVQDVHILTIKEYRVPAGGYVWSIPAGLINPNEDPIEAATRELKEETGLNLIRTVRDPSPLLLSAPGMSNERGYIVFCEAEGDLSTEGLEDSEDITPFLLTRGDMDDLLYRRKENFDCRAYLIFDRFVNHGDI